MSKPTHVLPNSITNAPTTLHSRRKGSVVTALLPVWRQGQENKKQKKRRDVVEYLENGIGGWEVKGVSRFLCMK